MQLPKRDAKTFPELPGYTITKQLYTGSRTVVYRARTIPQQQPVVIKILRQAYPSFNEIIQFRNQYAVARHLDFEGIARPLSLEPWQNSYALVMEDNGSISLAQYAREHPLDLEGVLRVAVQIAELLHHLHGCRVIHKDIKPANILIHPDTQQVKLIDFSIASLLPKESQEIQNPNILEGTLAYIAPEQTGRMNRAIDYRSDFYSLGVTLYELFTRQLPFPASEPLEVVHCHIAQSPIPPHQIAPNIPPVVSALVMKLMAKNAEDRYQSALGLKSDLEQCLKQWQESGQIEAFALGQQDLCDRFIIPEKLYGREAEVAQLLEAFERVSGRGQGTGDRGQSSGKGDSPLPTADSSAEMMLVAGFSGIGKTAVINEVHKPITRQKGYFIKGKFDQFNRNIPLSAFVQAFRDLMGQLLADSDEQLARWRSQILEAVGDNARVLIEVIPELERIIGEQPPVPELSGSAAQNRFNLVFQRFIAVFTRPEHPLTIFLDDLQWTDLASLQLIKLLMQDRDYLLLLGAYRDNEVSPGHPLMLAVEELKQAGKTINTITLAALPPNETNRLVADTLHCPPENAPPLSELIDRKTQGNPFFITQFLKALYEDRHLTFNRNCGYWECDIVNLKTLTISDDIVEFMGRQLQKLSKRTQESLKFAACMGNQFDLTTLAMVLEKTEAEIAASLWEALQEGLILPQSEIYKFYASDEQSEVHSEEQKNASYRFLHDRVQQAAYSSIVETEKDRTHYRIGQLLLEKIPAEQREERIFEIVSQLNYGESFIEDQNERDRLAQLNLIACRRARASVAYNASRDFARIGLNLLGEQAWEREYDLTLAFYNLTVELAYLCEDCEAVETLAEIATARAKTLLDRISIYQNQILSRIFHGQQNEALEFGLDILKQLGVTLPETPDEAAVAREMGDLARLMGDRSIEDLIDLPEATDSEKIATIQIAKILFSAAFFTNSPYWLFLASLAIKVSIEFGNAPDSALCYGSYGCLIGLAFKDVEAGARFGQLAVKLADKLDVKALKPEIAATVGGTLLHRKFPIRETLPLLRQGYELALDVRNLQYAVYNALIYLVNAFWTGLPLTTIERETRAYQSGPISIKSLPLQWQCILNLLKFSEEPTVLLGEVFNEFEFTNKSQNSTDNTHLFYIYLYRLFLSNLFGDFEGVKAIAHYRNYLPLAMGTVAEPAFYLYDSLAILAEFPPLGENASPAWQQVEENQVQLQFWARHAPMNYQHKVDLVEAEKCRILGRKLEALELYDKAIAGAKENEYVQEEALANELAAKFYLNWGKQQVAAGYMQQAYYAYTRWGAKAKTDDLERRYPELLGPILQSAPAPTFNLFDTLTTLAASNTVLLTSSSETRSSSSSLNNSLDFAVILKVAQSISSRIQFDELLAQLTGAILQNSGADRCALILPNRGGQWCVEAIATIESTQLCSQPLEESAEVPIKLIQYVKNTGRAIAIDNLNTPLPVPDPYLDRNRPQSILVQPILDRGHLVGLLYLENRLTQGAFTQERLLVLNFLCSQAAISLENARLYQEAKNYAQQLEQSQLQIVQSEKMASLGNLVAGVAHEINNPIGFLNGSVSNAKDFLSDLLEHLEIYQDCIPHPPEAVTEHAEEIDLEFVGADLPKLLDSMQGAIDRIKGISTSLRTFSRADSETPVRANLHEGLDSTLLILKYRLKANDKRPAIAVVKDYGNIPEVECFPGQLNQVFMNILANAIDAIDEGNAGRTFAEIEAHPNCIVLRTSVEAGEVKIAIADNGLGIPEKVKMQIFDHLFTTKGVGKGTGLGLAIARQIVEEKHQGTLKVSSTLGQGSEFIMSLPVR